MIDQPHSSKSYYPPGPHQLLQYSPKPTHTQSTPSNSTKFAMDFVLAHVTSQMSQDAGIKKTQMSFKEGLRRYGKAAETALMKEFAQLEDLEVYEAVDSRSLTTDQRRAALRAINLIKEKRSGVLKGRTVADGRAQRFLYEKSETASPTIATDALMLSIIIDAYEGRDVATADIAGAYLKAYMKDFVVMKFTGDTVRILCDMNPNHKRFVTTEHGQPTLYVRLIKAIYGCVKSALLWYELFSTSLQQMGFELNPYDRCVANCIIQGKQCTIGWYVDDTKISHEDSTVVTNIIARLENKFDKMTVVRGNQHVFLECTSPTTELTAQPPLS
jgi:Reverse transcriptase (RNA-dependent DNA polymerase)